MTFVCFFTVLLITSFKAFIELNHWRRFYILKYLRVALSLPWKLLISVF